MRLRFARQTDVLGRNTRPLPSLAPGDTVLIQNQTGRCPTRWDRTGSVVEVRPNDQYAIKVHGSGRVTLRNRRFLRPITGLLPYERPLGPGPHPSTPLPVVSTPGPSSAAAFPPPPPARATLHRSLPAGHPRHLLSLGKLPRPSPPPRRSSHPPELSGDLPRSMRHPADPPPPPPPPLLSRAPTRLSADSRPVPPRSRLCPPWRISSCVPRSSDRRARSLPPAEASGPGARPDI